MAPLNYCERCGNYFTPQGVEIKKAATGRGPVFDIPDSVCARCLLPNERIENDRVITLQELADRARYAENL